VIKGTPHANSVKLGGKIASGRYSIDLRQFDKKAQITFGYL
jgi:hypothetical protein